MRRCNSNCCSIGNSIALSLQEILLHEELFVANPFIPTFYLKLKHEELLSRNHLCSRRLRGNLIISIYMWGVLLPGVRPTCRHWTASFLCRCCCLLKDAQASLRQLRLVRWRLVTLDRPRSLQGTPYIVFLSDFSPAVCIRMYVFLPKPSTQNGWQVYVRLLTRVVQAFFTIHGRPPLNVPPLFVRRSEVFTNLCPSNMPRFTTLSLTLPSAEGGGFRARTLPSSNH